MNQAIETTETTEQLFRVTYRTSGLRRRTRTVDAETLQWMQRAWYAGIRVSSSRPATEAEAARGAFTGTLNG
jgi:hypothetical protein